MQIDVQPRGLRATRCSNFLFESTRTFSARRRPPLASPRSLCVVVVRSECGVGAGPPTRTHCHCSGGRAWRVRVGTSTCIRTRVYRRIHETTLLVSSYNSQACALETEMCACIVCFAQTMVLRVRFHTIGNARIKIVKVACT